MKAGTRITVTFIRPQGDVQERAKVARTMRYMLPMPAGYVPVRFDSGVLLVHVSAIRVQAAPHRTDGDVRIAQSRCEQSKAAA